MSVAYEPSPIAPLVNSDGTVDAEVVRLIVGDWFVAATETPPVYRAPIIVTEGRPLRFRTLRRTGRALRA
jgi:hypothetical protein